MRTSRSQPPRNEWHHSADGLLVIRSAIRGRPGKRRRGGDKVGSVVGYSRRSEGPPGTVLNFLDGEYSSTLTPPSSTEEDRIIYVLIIATRPSSRRRACSNSKIPTTYKGSISTGVTGSRSRARRTLSHVVITHLEDRNKYALLHSGFR